MEWHLKITGILLMALALIHAGFPRYFRWKQELAALSLMNRQMMVIHSFFIALTVFGMGLLSFSQAERLTGTALGKLVSLGLGAFWSIRLLVQLFGYSPRLWRGKRFETVMHVLFTALWTYICWVYLSAAGPVMR